MEAKIVKYGRGMNSPKAYRRNLYVEIQPSDLSEVINLTNTMLTWEFDPTNLEPWYRYQICKYCARRMTYEHEKFVKGEWIWNRRFCMRHYLIEHLYDISSYDDVIESNRYVELFASKDELRLNTRTNNYDYDIMIRRDYAAVNVLYKGTRYTFKYNNHLNSLPFASSYLILVYAVNRVADYLARFLEDVKHRMKDNKCAAFNVLINDKLVVPACSD
jgi:hypothetical protein